MKSNLNRSKPAFVYCSLAHQIQMSTKLTIRLLMLCLFSLCAHNLALAEDRFIPPGFFDELDSLNLNELPHYDELPVSVRREIPRPKLSVHYYNTDPEKRYALINHYRAY